MYFRIPAPAKGHIVLSRRGFLRKSGQVAVVAKNGWLAFSTRLRPSEGTGFRDWKKSLRASKKNSTVGLKN
jgi:hypothetical protein